MNTNTAITYITGHYAYVDANGQYNGGTEMLLIDPSLLTDRQWRNVDDMAELDRQNYIMSIIHGNSDRTTNIEESYGF
tara:strand:- start:10957 stop:11190 length:234 start_codon:yes stop_codon:yes gene_type:complete